MAQRPRRPWTPRRLAVHCRGPFLRLATLFTTLLACADPSPPRTEDVTTPKVALRLVVETEAETDPGAVKARVDGYFGTDSLVERLFEGPIPDEDPDRIAHFFVVMVPNARDPQQSEWDLAYGLRDATDFRRVEPDFKNTLEPQTEAEMAKGSCFLSDNSAPAKKGWSLANIRADAAWALELPEGGKRFGEGVLVCHPDTGWSEHMDLDRDHLDLDHAANIIDGGPDARDPFEEGPLLNPGHGTGTGSVIVSAGGVTDSGGTTGPGEVTGVAPAARLVPIRTARSVIQVFDSDLARAVHHSVRSGCHVISMSLGGRAFFGLRAAIRHAVRNQLIVAAAAGNCVRTVVAPAVYEECIAVAGTNSDDEPWRGSSRGAAVTISAPGEHVWVASWNKPNTPPNQVAPGQGTSFAVANVAGVATLWLAYHGPAALAQQYSGTARLQHVFVDLAQKTARTPENWKPDKFGPGIIDAEALLREPLPDPADATAKRVAPADSELALMARMLDRDEDDVKNAMSLILEIPVDQVQSELEVWGPEMMQIWLESRGEFERVLSELEGSAGDPTSRRAKARSSLRPLASQRLRDAMQ